MKKIKKQIGWTIDNYALHNEMMRVAAERLDDERDKRYAEGNELRAMALKIKETADLTALELARESQVYKDERNDAMREQNLKETGIYATRDDLALAFTKSEKSLAGVVDELKTTLKPILDHIAVEKKNDLSIGKLFAIVTVVCVVLGVIISITTYLIK